MPDMPTPVTVTTTALQILNSALSSLKIVRERAQTSKDADLKAHISTLYDDVLSLKEVVMLLTDENNELKRKTALAEQQPSPELRLVGSANFYFVGDKGPYCQPCYDRDKKLTALTPPERWNHGVRRQCVLCHGYFYEIPMQLGAVRRTVRSRGPQGWME